MRFFNGDEVPVREHVRKDGAGRILEYFGSHETIDLEPQGFLVEKPYAGARINPHFHDIDQFQVVVGGGGRIGKKALAPVTVQYADAYTPYGPIVADDEGIRFFTLRAMASGGHYHMPGSRHAMPGRAGRNIASALDPHRPPPAPGEAVWETLFPPQDDGVSAHALHLGARALCEAPAPVGHGRFALVCAGALVDEDGRQLGPEALSHQPTGGPATRLRAGDVGAIVMLLGFGRPGERPGSNPAQLAARDPGGYIARDEST